MLQILPFRFVLLLGFSASTRLIAQWRPPLVVVCASSLNIKLSHDKDSEAGEVCSLKATKEYV